MGFSTRPSVSTWCEFVLSLLVLIVAIGKVTLPLLSRLFPIEASRSNSRAWHLPASGSSKGCEGFISPLRFNDLWSPTIMDGLWLMLSGMDAFGTRVEASQLASQEKLMYSTRVALLYTLNLAASWPQIAKAQGVRQNYPPSNIRLSQFDQHIQSLSKSTNKVVQNEL